MVINKQGIFGWVAVDETGVVGIYNYPPYRTYANGIGYWECLGGCFTLPKTEFSTMTWGNEPIKVRMDLVITGN